METLKFHLLDQITDDITQWKAQITYIVACRRDPLKLSKVCTKAVQASLELHGEGPEKAGGSRTIV